MAPSSPQGGCGGVTRQGVLPQGGVGGEGVLSPGRAGGSQLLFLGRNWNFCHPVPGGRGEAWGQGRLRADPCQRGRGGCCTPQGVCWGLTLPHPPVARWVLGAEPPAPLEGGCWGPPQGGCSGQTPTYSGCGSNPGGCAGPPLALLYLSSNPGGCLPQPPLQPPHLPPFPGGAAPPGRDQPWPPPRGRGPKAATSLICIKNLFNSHCV